MDKSKFQDAGRNDPCPCGSGKKYKKCCMGKMKRGFTAKVITGGTGMGLGGLMSGAAKQQTADVSDFHKRQAEKEKNGDATKDADEKADSPLGDLEITLEEEDA